MHKNIVVIGGGSGILAVLHPFKDKSLRVSAIVSVADDGGSSGILRKELGVLPPGAIRKPLLALSKKEKFWHNLFEYRFQRGSCIGHPVGNIILSAAMLLEEDVQKAVNHVSSLLDLQGRVIPVATKQVTLVAELENGMRVYGETNIDVPKHNGTLRIKKIWLEPSVKANPAALFAIKKADLVIIGPGDIYSSIIPNLVVKGMSDALKKAKAKKVYICNLMTEFGETTGFRASDFFRALKPYLSPIDYFFVNTKEPSLQALNVYKKERCEFVVPDKKELSRLPTTLIYGSFITSTLPLRHNSKKLASILLTLSNP